MEARRAKWLPVWMSLLWLFGAGSILHGQERSKAIEDWRITGSFKTSDDSYPKNEDVVARLAYVRTKGPPLVVSGVIKISDQGVFSLTPEPGRKTSNLYPGTWCLGFYWKGRIATVDPFELKGSPAHIENLHVSFGRQENRSLRARIVNPDDAKKGIPDLEVVAQLSDDASICLALRGLEITRGKTDNLGNIVFKGLPNHNIVLRAADDVRKMAFGKPNGSWISADAIVQPQADMVSGDSIPIFYYAPKGKGVYWDAILNKVDTPNGPRYRRLAKGTELEIRALRNFDSPHWNPDLKFYVTVGEDSLIKTPVVPSGEYAVETRKGDKFEGVIGIDGMCSNSSITFHSILDGPWVIDDLQNEVKLESRNAKIIQNGEVSEVLFSGNHPQELLVSGLTDSDKFVVTINRLTKELVAKAGTISIPLDYSSKVLDEPDFVRISSVSLPRKTLCKILLYPVKVKLFDKTFENEEFNHAAIMLSAPNIQDQTTVKYRILPWHPSLAEKVSFRLLSPLLCNAKLSISEAKPSAQSGELKVAASTVSPGMTALVAEFDSNPPQECNIERLAIYLQIEKVSIVSEAPGAVEVQELDAVLKEIFPEPRTEDTSKAVGKIKTILGKQSIPGLVTGLKATTANQRLEISRGVLRATDDEAADIILSFAELAIRHASSK